MHGVNAFRTEKTRKESQKPRSQKTTTNQQGKPKSRKGKSQKKKIPKRKQKIPKKIGFLSTSSTDETAAQKSRRQEFERH